MLAVWPIRSGDRWHSCPHSCPLFESHTRATATARFDGSGLTSNEVVENRDALRFLDALMGSDLHFETAVDSGVAGRILGFWPDYCPGAWPWLPALRGSQFAAARVVLLPDPINRLRAWDPYSDRQPGVMPAPGRAPSPVGATWRVPCAAARRPRRSRGVQQADHRRGQLIHAVRARPAPACSPPSAVLSGRPSARATSEQT